MSSLAWPILGDVQENIQIEKILIHCIIFSGRPKLKDIADHIFDILENSFNAEANEVVLKIAYDKNHFFCSISDNGRGITGQEVLDPFVTTRKTRRIGLGLPLLERAAEDTGGYLKIRRKDEAGGTELEFEINTSHIDAKPFGDLAMTFSDIFLSRPDIGLKIFIIKEGREHLILDFSGLQKEIEEGSKDYLQIRKHIYETTKKELKSINVV